MERHYSPTAASILFSLTLCVVFHGPARSQTIDMDHVLAPIGSSFHLYSIFQTFPWDTLQGTGVVWEYGWTEVDSTADKAISMIPITAAPNASAYPEADRVERSITGGNYVIDRFLDVQADRVRELGSVGPVLSYEYDDPETLYTYPMQLGDTSFGTYCVWSDGLGSQFHFCGDSYVTFDATGTLTLPYGTFTEVKHTTRWHQSIETTTPGGDTTIFVRQQWFLQDVPYPVLEVTVSFYSDGFVSPSGWLMDGATLTGLREEHAEVRWSVSPVPTIGPITVMSAFDGSARLEILSLDGRVIATQPLPPGTARHQFSLTEQPDGVYLVRMNSEGRTSVRRIIKVSGD